MKNREQALELAVKVVKLLKEGSRYLRESSILSLQSSSLMATLSVMSAASSRKVSALDPSICEIILFGSATEEGKIPGDLDLMIFDQGFYSDVLMSSTRPQIYGMGNRVETNFLSLLTGWFGFNENMPEVHDVLKETNVDLLVLPLSVFTDHMRRQEIASHQYDPEFFQNAFASMMRFEDVIGQFVEVDLAYFEEKYHTDLSRLRKTVKLTV